MAFPLLGNFDYVVSVFIYCLPNSKGDALFHCIAYDYSCDGWDGLSDHFSETSTAASELVSGFILELMCISLIINIR